MIVTSTNNIEGKEIYEYRGLVFGEVVQGINFLKDYLASWTDAMGGRSGTYEDEIKEARNQAIREMIANAQDVEANAIIGARIDYEVLGQKNGMILVSASGTAVRVIDKDKKKPKEYNMEISDF